MIRLGMGTGLVVAAVLVLGACVADPAEPVGRTGAAGGSCVVIADCNDMDQCTTDLCLLGTCSHTALPLCCSDASECEDGLLCTLDVCLLGGMCTFSPILDCDAGVARDAGMDGGAIDAGIDAAVLPDAGLDTGVLPDTGVDAMLPIDAGVDAMLPIDAGLDASIVLDAGRDSGPADAGSDAGEDAGLDAGRDSGPADAGPDTGPMLDAGPRPRPHLRGGACTIAPSPPRSRGVPGWLLLALGLVLLRRRRTPVRARYGQKGSDPFGHSSAGVVPALSIVVVGVWLFASVASAQGFRVDRYPAPVSPDDLFWVERAAPEEGSLVPWFRLAAVYADDPLVVEINGAERAAVVGEQMGMHASVGLTLASRLHVAIAMPLYVQSGDDVDLGPGEPVLDVGGAAPGDPRLDVRLVLLDRQAPLELALAATLRVPLGAPDALVGDDGISVIPRLVISRALGERGSFISLSGGVGLRPEAHAADLLVDHEVVLAAGALLAVSHRFAVTAELAASTLAKDAFAAQTTPIEATGGIRYHHGSGLVIALGAGAGLTQGVGAPDARVLLAMAFRPRAATPTAPVVLADPDRDRDGVPNATDRCPDVPEDADGLADEDGCPEEDNDGDGVLDGIDECDLVAEDRDGHEDEDGCPEWDNDGDGIPDLSDACPIEAEDRDAWRDEDGCPDPDNDGDGLPDGTDQCPNEAETVNGTADEDGCPDFIRVEAREIRTLEPVYFVTNRDTIQDRSHPMLVEMARVLAANAELGRVSIEGHTDSRGSDRHNQDLSDRRARSVMRFLVDAGVTPDRLEAIGYGEARPVADNRSSGGRALNRRVVFRLMDRPQEQAPPAPEPPPATTAPVPVPAAPPPG